MSISAINNSIRNESQIFAYGKDMKYMSKDFSVPEIEPIKGIAKEDIVDINFDKVEKYKSQFDKTQNENQKTNSKLTEQEEKAVEALKKRDTEVRQHEQAHITAGGGLVRGGASYTYSVGPDGKQYATGGEVNIDISPEEDPQKTIAKMQKVVAAALAPTEPSGQDYSVVNSAKRIEADAQKQLAEEKDVAKHTTKQNKSAVNAPKVQSYNTANSGKLSYNNDVLKKSYQMFNDSVTHTYQHYA